MSVDGGSAITGVLSGSAIYQSAKSSIGGGIRQVRIHKRKPVVLFAVWAVDVPAESQIEADFRTQLPIILHKRGIIAIPMAGPDNVVIGYRGRGDGAQHVTGVRISGGRDQRAGSGVARGLVIAEAEA